MDLTRNTDFTDGEDVYGDKLQRLVEDTKVAANAVENAMLAAMPARTLKGNIDGYDATLPDINDALNLARVDVASAATCAIGAAQSPYVRITGTTTITAFDTVPSGRMRTVLFAAVLILTHNATSLILPGGANKTTAAGDVALFVSEGAGDWRCLYFRHPADGPTPPPEPPIPPDPPLTVYFNNRGRDYNIQSFEVSVDGGAYVTETFPNDNGDGTTISGAYVADHQLKYKMTLAPDTYMSVPPVVSAYVRALFSDTRAVTGSATAVGEVTSPATFQVKVSVGTPNAIANNPASSTFSYSASLAQAIGTGNCDMYVLSNANAPYTVVSGTLEVIMDF